MKKGSGAGGNGRNHTYAASRADGRDARGADGSCEIAGRSLSHLTGAAVLHAFYGRISSRNCGDSRAAVMLISMERIRY